MEGSAFFPVPVFKHQKQFFATSISPLPLPLFLPLLSRKTLEKFDMVTAPPGRADMGTKIIDTIADAGVPVS